MRCTLRTALVTVTVLLCVWVNQGWAQPTIRLRFPTHGDIQFENSSSLVVPPGVASLEIWVRGTLADISVSSVRVRLNEMPMTPFVSINQLPRGVRLIVKFGATLSPDYNLKRETENLLTFDAVDTGRVSYRGQFYLILDENASVPHLAPTRVSPTRPEVEPAPLQRPPQAAFTSEWPARSAERVLQLAAEVTDNEGIRRIVVEVNGKDVEEVLLENEQPVRKKNGWIARGALPGTVTGNGKKITLLIPVSLGKEINVVAVRVENLLGLRTRIDRTVQRIRQ